MPQVKPNCCHCNTPLTKYNTPTPAMLQAFSNSLGGPLTPKELPDMEHHLEALMEYEGTEAGKQMLQQWDVRAIEDTNHLTAFQVRGFRNEILMYRNQPQESTRILRVLRRLKAKPMSKTVLFETGIEAAVSLLSTHQHFDVQGVALELMEKWLEQYADEVRTPSFMQPPRNSSATSSARPDHLTALMQDIADTARNSDLDNANSGPVCGTTDSAVGRRTNGSCNIDGTGRSDSSHDPTLTMADRRLISTDSTSILRTPSSKSSVLTAESIVYGLASLCEETLAGASRPAAEGGDQSSSQSASAKQLPRTDFLEPVYERLSKELPRPRPVIRTLEEFLSTAKSYLRSDDKTMDPLMDELCTSYHGVTGTLDLTAATITAKMTIRSCSTFTRNQIRAKDVEISEMDRQEEVDHTTSPARQSLVKDRLDLEQTLKRQTEELEKATILHEGFESDLLMSLLHPLERMLDVMCLPEGDTRSLGTYISDSRVSQQTVHQLEHELKSTNATLATAQKQLKKTQSDLNVLSTQFALAQSTNAKLKKDMDNERVSINSKYYKDVEIQVEERVQHEKARSAARLREVEAKAQQHDAAKTEALDLRKQIKDSTHKIAMQVAARADLEERYKMLEEKEASTQQGYDQMRQNKLEAEARAAALEADLRALHTKFEDVQGVLALNKTESEELERAAGSQGSGPSTIEIVTHSEQLTEADRLDMIAQKWRNDLQLAESEQKKHEAALKGTDTQIAVALRQLRELGAPSARSKGRNPTQTRLNTAEHTGESFSVSRPGVPSEPPIVDAFSPPMASLAPWSRMDEQLNGRNRTTQQISLELDMVFTCEPDAVIKTDPVHNQEPRARSSTPTTRTMAYDDDTGGVSVVEDHLFGGPVTDTGLPFGMQVDTYAEDTIKSLLQERNTWKEQAEQQTKAYEELQRRLYKKAVIDVDLPAEIVRRLNRLESDNERYRTENMDLRESLRATKHEVAALQDEIVGQKNKLKGAGKKVRNTKGVAGEQEEKARVAAQYKKLRVSSERKMKQERNEALAEAQSLQKLCDDLQSQLEVEESGFSHLRKGDSASDTTTAVILIELKIHRGDFVKLTDVFDSNRIAITDQLQDWYESWKKPKEATREVVGKNYTKNKESGKSAVDMNRLYADMIEFVDGHQKTGAEQDGPRSKHSLETVCRKAEGRQNCED